MEKHSSVYQGYLNALNQPSSPSNQYPTNSLAVDSAQPEEQNPGQNDTINVKDHGDFDSQDPGTLVSSI